MGIRSPVQERKQGRSEGIRLQPGLVLARAQMADGKEKEEGRFCRVSPGRHEGSFVVLLVTDSHSHPRVKRSQTPTRFYVSCP